MRCLVVADLHYSLPQFDWVLAVAPHFDLVIVAGDALDIGSLVDFRAQIAVVRKYLALLSEITPVFSVRAFIIWTNAMTEARKLLAGLTLFMTT